MKHMRKWRLMVCALLTQSILFGQTDPGFLIPADANMVIHLNLGSMAKKMPWSSITSRDFFQYLAKDIPADNQNFFKNPEETGIDFKSGLWIVVKKDPENSASPANYLMMAGYIGNQEKFSQLLHSGLGGNVSFIDQEEFHYAINKEASLAWNNKQFVAMVSIKEKEAGKKKSDKRMPKAESNGIVKQLYSWLNPEPAMSLYADPRFRQLLAQDADFRVWSDGSVKVDGKSKKLKGLEGLNAPILTKGNYTATAVSFENGRILSTTTRWYNKELLPSMKNMYSHPMNTALLQKIPAGSPLMVMNFSMNTKGVDQFLAHTGLGKIFNDLMKESNLSLEEFSEVLEGDVMMVVNLPERGKVEDADPDAPPAQENPFADIQIYLAATVKDVDKTNNLVKKIKLQLEAEKKKKDSLRALQGEWAMPDSVWDINESGDTISPYKVEDEEVKTPPVIIDTTEVKVVEIDSEGIQVPPPPPAKKMDFKPITEIRDSLFVLSFSEKSMKAFWDNTSNAGMKSFADQYGKHPMILQVDLKTLMSFLIPLVNSKFPSEGDQNPTALLEIFDKLTVSGGAFDGDGLKSQTEFSFTDSSQNSLSLLMNILESFGGAVKQLAAGAGEKENNSMGSGEGDVELMDIPPPIEDAPKVEIVNESAYDVAPEFIGGEKAWNKFLKQNLNKNVPKENQAPAGTYEVEVEFLVGADGKPSDFIALTGHGYGLEEEAIRVLSKVQKWKPATKEGKAVEAVMKRRILFEVKE